jgi:C-terminal processing protease CtpA/Prc
MNFKAILLTTAFALCVTFDLSAQSAVAYPDIYLRDRIAKGRAMSAAEVRRFADLGRTWGILNYFNPQMNSGKVSTDSIALQSLRILLHDGSAAGFQQAIRHLLAAAGDPGSGVTDTNSDAAAPALLFTKEQAPPKVFTLKDSVLFIAFPTRSADYIDDPASIKGLLPSDWNTAKAILIDIRNSTPSAAYNEYSFAYDVMPKLIEALAGNQPLPAVYERRIYHNGFVAQSSNAPNIYNSGIQTIAAPGYSVSTSAKPLGKPVAFVFNGNTNIDLLKQLWVLRTAGLCALIYEGTPGSYPMGDTKTYPLADGITVKIRINGYQLSGNQPVPQPDLTIGRIADTSLSGSFIGAAMRLLKNPLSPISSTASANADFVQPRPGRYADTLVPSADLRLFGLYNFWNAIHFFSPYKEGLDHPWDPVLDQYIPIMLNADDSLSYMLAVRSLASETQDCHGFVANNRPATPARKFYGAWPPVQLGFVRHRIYITEFARDSSQDLSTLRLGDEVTHIDGKPIAAHAATWRHYLPASNENTYERDLSNYLPVGPLNSNVSFTIRRGTQTFKITLRRNGRWNLSRGILDFNRKHPTIELLSGNIGYINMGNLRGAQVDSVMKAFSQTKAIIFDIRNYPQGTAWAIAPKLTDSIRKAVLFDKPFVDYNYLTGGEDQSTLKSAFTVLPGDGTRYKGKIVLLCDRTTQSQAEYSIMMFQGAAKCTVIGSQTAGADGNVTDVVLPGGYAVSFSGLGIYYPDGTPTQRRGIKVDIQSEPTIEGLIKQKDEVLDRALQFLREGK